MGGTLGTVCEDLCYSSRTKTLPKAYEGLPEEEKRMLEETLEMDSMEKNKMKNRNTLSKQEIFGMVYQKHKTDHEFFTRVEKWHKMNETTKTPLLFDKEMFILLYPNYRQEQFDMERHWDKVDMTTIIHKEFSRNATDVIVPEWKYIIRRGIPMARIRDILLHMYKKMFVDNESEYQTRSSVIFQDKIPTSFKNTPTFAAEETLEGLLKINLLTPAGLIALKRILWILKESIRYLEYSPMLPLILSLMLLFLTEAEAYCIVKVMLEQSLSLLDESHQYKASELKGLRWHFTFVEEDFKKTTRSFIDTITIKSKSFAETIQHFDNIRFDYETLFSNWFATIFIGFLPFPMILQAFNFYMNEGIKIYYRLGYAVLRVFKDEIMAHKEPETLTEKLRGLALALDSEGMRSLTKKMWTLRLTEIKNRFSKVDVTTPGERSPSKRSTINQPKSGSSSIQAPMSQKRKVLYRPHLTESSRIVPDDTFELIWEWIPNIYKISDPTLAYATWRDGFSLNSMYKKCGAYVGSGMVFLVKTDRDTVFGGFCDEIFHPVNDIRDDLPFYGSNESFVFTLKPNEKIFACTEKNSSHVLSTKTSILMGTGK